MIWFFAEVRYGSASSYMSLNVVSVFALSVIPTKGYHPNDLLVLIGLLDTLLSKSLISCIIPVILTISYSTAVCR